MEDQHLTHYQTDPSIPAYLKKRFATAKDDDAKQPNETQVTAKSEADDVQNPPDTHTLETLSTADELTAEQTAPLNTEAHNEWKGRLQKEQHLHQQTNAKLLAEIDAREKAEAEKAKLEAELQALRQPPSPLPNAEEPLSDAELEEIDMHLGGLGKKLVKSLRQTQTAQPLPDVGKLVEDKFNQYQTQTLAEQKKAQWQQAVLEQIPDIHGLLTKPAFLTFINSKEVDFEGNTAATLITRAGETQNINLIPKIKALMEEFNQMQQPTQAVSTASPSNQRSGIKAPAAKPKMTAKDIARKNLLVRQGKTDELIAFLAKFET